MDPGLLKKRAVPVLISFLVGASIAVSTAIDHGRYKFTKLSRKADQDLEV